MKLFPKQNSDFLIEMTKNELFIIRGVLSHITLKAVMGKDYDIKQSTGWDEAEIVLFLTTIKQSCTVSLSEEDVIFLQKAIEDTTSRIGQEFSMVIGRSIEEALIVRDSFSKILKLAKS
jgi:hypothetical protein